MRQAPPLPSADSLCLPIDISPFANEVSWFHTVEKLLDMGANTLGVLLGWTLALRFPSVLPGAGTETQ